MLDTADVGRRGVAVPSRLLRLQPYEALIFVVLIVLFALCLAVAPVVTAEVEKEETRIGGQNDEVIRARPLVL